MLCWFTHFLILAIYFQGVLQPDMWGVTPSKRWDWDALREQIAKHGVRNSLLVAPMPTASTSQILGNNECFEPYTSNIYSRRVLRSSFQFELLEPFVLIIYVDSKIFLSIPQWWICCCEQASPAWLNGDGFVVSCTEKQDYLWEWLCSKDSRNPWWAKSYL